MEYRETKEESVESDHDVNGKRSKQKCMDERNQRN